MNTTSPTAPEAAPSVVVKPTKSKGERFFDWAVYGGLAGVGTFVATVGLTYLFKYAPRGEKYYHGLVDGLHKGVTKIAPGLLSKKIAEDAVLTTTLMMGGNVMLAPVAYAEKHKVNTVKGLNTILGDPTPPEQIEQEPQQTIGSLIKARLAAWGVVFAALFGASSIFPKSFHTFENEFAKRTCEILDKPTTVRKIVEEISEETKKVVQKRKSVPSTTYLLGKISALDIFATAASAVLLYVAGHTFARKREEKIERRAATHAPSHTAQADEAPSIEAVPNNAPQPTIEGARSLEGKAIEPSLAMANQL